MCVHLPLLLKLFIVFGIVFGILFGIVFGIVGIRWYTAVSLCITVLFVIY